MSKLFGRYESFTIDFNNFSWHLEGGWGGDHVPPALSGNFINNINIDNQHSISFVDNKDGNVLVELSFCREFSFYLDHDTEEQVYGEMTFQNVSLYTPWEDGHFVNWEDYRYETETQFDQINDFLKNIKEINKGYVAGTVSRDYDATIYRYTHISYIEIRTGCSTHEEITAYMFDDQTQALIRITNIGSYMYEPFMIQLCIKFDEDGKISTVDQDGSLSYLAKDNPADKLVSFIRRLAAENED